MEDYRPNREPLVMSGRMECHVRDMTATIGADMTLQQVQAELGEHGQWLPVDGPMDVPVSRLVEMNSAGPLRLGYGAWRDLLLGCQFINGKDELISAGGRTVKNVAGYDLTKLMVGQQGSLCWIITITTRTYRRPGMAMLATFDLQPMLINELLPTPCRPHWVVAEAEGITCGYFGDETAIRFYQQALPRFRVNGMHEVSAAQEQAFRAQRWAERWTSSSFRVSVPPGQITTFIERAKVVDWVADPAFGIVLGKTDDGAAVRKAAELLGGVAMVRQSDGTFAHPVRGAAEARIIQELKKAFDPDSRLAPLPLTD